MIYMACAMGAIWSVALFIMGVQHISKAEGVVKGTIVPFLCLFVFSFLLVIIIYYLEPVIDNNQTSIIMLTAILISLSVLSGIIIGRRRLQRIRRCILSFYVLYRKTFSLNKRKLFFDKIVPYAFYGAFSLTFFFFLCILLNLTFYSINFWLFILLIAIIILIIISKKR
jgi:hypothetical protein